jgi:hypothetical protein
MALTMADPARFVVKADNGLIIPLPFGSVASASTWLLTGMSGASALLGACPAQAGAARIEPASRIAAERVRIIGRSYLLMFIDGDIGMESCGVAWLVGAGPLCVGGGADGGSGSPIARFIAGISCIWLMMIS